MAAAKCASLATADCAGSSVVSLISRNGTDVGIQLAGMPGRWFVAEAAPVADALLREGNGADDAARDIGDSAVIECVGLGGMALAAAPRSPPSSAAAPRRRRPDGADGRDLLGALKALHDHRPGLRRHAGGHRRRLVVELGVTPQITTGVLHAHAGTGQIGAGVAHQPVEPFRAAIAALAASLDDG